MSTPAKRAVFLDRARVLNAAIPHKIIRKAMLLINYDPEQLSVETVQMFDRDAKAAGFCLEETFRW
jgi:hypothetical protein